MLLDVFFSGYLLKMGNWKRTGGKLLVKIVGEKRNKCSGSFK